MIMASFAAGVSGRSDIEKTPTASERLWDSGSEQPNDHIWLLSIFDSTYQDYMQLI